jgi:hypothetical protein
LDSKFAKERRCLRQQVCFWGKILNAEILYLGKINKRKSKRMEEDNKEMPTANLKHPILAFLRYISWICLWMMAAASTSAICSLFRQ